MTGRHGAEGDKLPDVVLLYSDIVFFLFIFIHNLSPKRLAPLQTLCLWKEFSFTA